MSAFCICKDQNLGPGTGAYLVRYQCQLRVSTVHSSCIQGLRENAAMRLGGLASQIQRNDRVRLPASREVKAERFHPDPVLWHKELGIGCSLPPSFLAARKRGITFRVTTAGAVHWFGPTRAVTQELLSGLEESVLDVLAYLRWEEERDGPQTLHVTF